MILQDTKPNTWHRLTEHPDHVNKSGPTEFYVSWSIDTVTGQPVVHSRDHAWACPIHRVSGANRVHAYLNTPVID